MSSYPPLRAISFFLSCVVVILLIVFVHAVAVARLVCPCLCPCCRPVPDHPLVWCFLKVFHLIPTFSRNVSVNSTQWTVPWSLSLLTSHRRQIHRHNQRASSCQFSVFDVFFHKFREFFHAGSVDQQVTSQTTSVQTSDDNTNFDQVRQCVFRVMLPGCCSSLKIGQRA